MKQQAFFKEFEPVSKEQWIAQINKDLKGADFDEKLVWNSQEGINIQPVYTEEDIAELEHLKSLHQQYFEEETAFLGARRWQYNQYVLASEEKQANAQALQALNEGAEAICFDLSQRSSPPQWEVLLKDIQWPYCAVSFKSTTQQAPWTQGLIDYWQQQEITPDTPNGFWQTDSAEGNREAGAFFMQFPHFKGFAITHPASLLKVSDKIGTLILEYYRCVNASKASAAAVLKNSCFHYQTDNNYFFQIAGMRALTFLLKGMLQSYGEQAEGIKPTLHAITSIEVSEATQQDPEWNMLSNTTQAMSGILGGCQYLTIRPHNQGITPVDGFSERIARNVSNLLREESYFDKVADPVAGAYYLEHLTEQLATQAWAYFQAKI